jgi:hypothetical protein
MFDSFSSRANQSAVDRLIQMATGKKTAAPAEEKPAAPEVVEQPQPAEASVADQETPAFDATPEAAMEAAPEVQPEAVAEQPVDSVATSPAQEEVVDERPFHEPAPAAPVELPVEVASEPAVEEAAAVEAEPVEAPMETEAVSTSEPAVEEAAAVEAEPAEAPIETEAVSTSEPAVEEAAPVAEAVSEDAATNERGNEQPFHEGAAEVPVEEPAAEINAAEEPAAAVAKVAEESEGEEKIEEYAVGEESARGQEMRWGQESLSGGWMGSQKRNRKLPLPDAREGGSLTTEEYRRLKAERRISGADVVPSPEETSYLKMGRTSEEVTEQELRRMSQDPMWKTLVQFKGWLPVVTSLLPVLDMASGRSEPGSSAEMKDTMDGLLISHRDVRATLQTQTTELKRVEEEVAKLRDAADKTAFEQTVMSDEVKSMQRLVKNASMYLGILLGLLVAVVGYMAFLVFSYLNHPVH